MNHGRNQILHFQVVQKLLLKDCVGLLVIILALFHFSDLLDFSLCRCNSITGQYSKKNSTIHKMVFEIICTLFCCKTIQKLRLKLRFPYPKKKSILFGHHLFFLLSPSSNLTTFLEILVPINEPQGLPKQQMEKV